MAYDEGFCDAMASPCKTESQLARTPLPAPTGPPNELDSTDSCVPPIPKSASPASKQSKKAEVQSAMAEPCETESLSARTSLLALPGPPPLFDSTVVPDLLIPISLSPAPTALPPLRLQFFNSASTQTATIQHWFSYCYSNTQTSLLLL